MNVYCINTSYDMTNNGIVKDWIADTPAGITADFDAESSPGSTLLILSTKDLYVTNSKGAWQKYGTEEVLA